MLYPLKFTPIFKERIWGGEMLNVKLDKFIPAEVLTGESWELSGVEGDLSVVENGFLKGNDIQEIAETYMGDLVGESVYRKFGSGFPLLIKFIDAQQTLSIQVHPNDALAEERHGCAGKNEMWYVVDAGEEAVLYIGFKAGVTKEQYLESLKKGNVDTLLNRIPVKKGDIYFIPAGTVHAIGAGVLIAEIQQTSDITYRIFDWNKKDKNGKPRELHTELALEAIDFESGRPKNLAPQKQANELVRIQRSPYFASGLLELEGTLERELPNRDSFTVYIAVEGDAYLEAGGETVSLLLGEVVLVPAQLTEHKLTGKGTFLEIYMPEEKA